jgi:hypothetical protein
MSFINYHQMSRLHRQIAGVLAAALVSYPSPSRAQAPLVPLRTRWPARLAVGMRQGDQLSPLTVEARRDGWVVFTQLSTRPDEGLSPPSMRLIAEARDVRAWTSRVRALMSAVLDSGNARRANENPTLGNGRFRISVSITSSKPQFISFSVQGCGPGSGSSGPTRGELTRFLDLLDEAAARAGNGAGRPPTLLRPYYASEVSCPATANPDNPVPQLPAGARRSGGRIEVAAGFVVDTAGQVEAGTLRFFPGTEPELARAVRNVIPRWQFVPAEWDGAPVRQVVYTTIGISPTAPSDTGWHVIRVEPQDDGWVHFTHSNLSGTYTHVVQEWFAPDSVDAWAKRVEALNAEADSLDRETPRVLEKGTMLGSPKGVGYSAGFFAHGKAVEMRAGLVGCAGAFVEGERPVDSAQLARLREAASVARSRRASPADPARTAHEADDVACPAWLPWTRTPRPEFNRVWRYPIGAYPPSMAAANARADVFASFVVDTSGRVDLSSVRVLPGSDPRAVAALPATLRALRVRPATRGGRAVPQRVVQSIRFEPPPICATPTANPACGRRYSADLNADQPPAR